MMGGGSQPNQEDMFAKLESMRAVINEVNTQFKDPEKTTFICVCISEFLSVYETERLIQELTQYEIDTHAIVVNQLLYPPKGKCLSATSVSLRAQSVSTPSTPSPSFPSGSNCDHCRVRQSMQAKYLDSIVELYGEDFHIVKVPLETSEIRGTDKLREFSNYLVQPFRPPQ